MQRGPHQFQIVIVVYMIEVHERYDPRIGAPAAEMDPQVGAVEMAGQQLRGQPSRPLVEIAQQDARPDVSAVREDLLVEQPPRLMSSLEVRRSQVHIVDMEQLVAVEVDIDAEAAALLAAGDADVVVMRPDEGKPAENHISISRAVQASILAQLKMHPQFAGNEMGLIMMVFLALQAQHFLQANDVGVDLLQNLDDALGFDPPIQSPAFVNVIRGDAKFTDFPHGRLKRAGYRDDGLRDRV